MYSMNEVKLGRYKHYNGKFYELIAVGRIRKDKETVVVYRGLYEDPEFGKNPVWVQPKARFFENVKVDGVEMPRFQYYNPGVD